jgi:hypothetical protein
MPTDVNLWIVLAIAVAAVAALAIWRGNNVILKFKGFQFGASENPKPTISSDVSVAEGAVIGGNVGRVVGRRHSDEVPISGNTDVARQMKVEGSVDEIVGVETRPKGQ